VFLITGLRIIQRFHSDVTEKPDIHHYRQSRDAIVYIGSFDAGY